MTHEKTSVNYLIELIYNEAKDLADKRDEINRIKEWQKNIAEIIDILSIKNYNEVYDKLPYISILIDNAGLTPIETEKDSIKDVINKKLLDSLNLLKNTKEDVKEYQQALNEFNKITDILYGQLNNNEARSEILNSQYDKDLLAKYKSILTRFKYRQPLIEGDIQTINNFLDAKKIDNRTQIILVEKLKNYSVKLLDDYQAKPSNPEERFDIINMLSSGFEEFKNNDNLNKVSKKKISDEVKSLSSIISYYEDDHDTLLKLLPKTEDKTYNAEEIEEILIGILEEYQDKMHSQVEFISDKDFYMNDETRDNIRSDYFKYVAVYNFIRNYYHKLLEVQMNPEVLSQESVKTNNLIYSHNSDNVGFIERDLTEIPNEYYESILDLLSRFKTNELKPREIKQLSNNGVYKQFKELKSDQIRIVFKHIYGNYYCITGVGLKKANNDISLYRHLCSRPTIDNDNLEVLEKELKISQTIDATIEEYCKENARKANR